MIALLLLLLPLPTPEVARAELHPDAAACFGALLDPPTSAGPLLTWDAAIAARCGALISAAGCRPMPLHGGCDAAAEALANARAIYVRLTAALLGRPPRHHSFLWLHGQAHPHPLDLYTATALGGLSSPEMHAWLIAGLLLRHIVPDPPFQGALR